MTFNQEKYNKAVEAKDILLDYLNDVIDWYTEPSGTHFADTAKEKVLYFALTQEYLLGN